MAKSAEEDKQKKLVAVKAAEDKRKKPVAGKAAEDKQKPAAAKVEDHVSPQDKWLTECYAGRHRPKWTADMVVPLEQMLA